jgi:hypothetical protein
MKVHLRHEYPIIFMAGAPEKTAPGKNPLRDDFVNNRCMFIAQQRKVILSFASELMRLNEHYYLKYSTADSNI